MKTECRRTARCGGIFHGRYMGLLPVPAMARACTKTAMGADNPAMRLSICLWRWFKTALLLACGLALAGCAAPPATPSVIERTWAGANDSAWERYVFPGKNASEYRYDRLDARDVVSARAKGSASMLRRKVHVVPADLGHIRFSWKVPALITDADLASRDADDSPVRIVLAFEGDRSGFSAKNAALSELSRLLTGEEMPYATLMYVWCNKREAGKVVMSPRTDRIRTLVVESGPRNLNQWLNYERDIRADFESAFGEAPGALVGIALMTDTDNTQSQAQAWYGPVSLAPRAAASAPAPALEN
jgi:hypothetical protein